MSHGMKTSTFNFSSKQEKWKIQMITEKLNFSVILSDLSKKYIINEKIKPREFVQKLCECQNESIIFNDSSRLVGRFTVYLLVAHSVSGVTT